MVPIYSARSNLFGPDRDSDLSIRGDLRGAKPSDEDSLVPDRDRAEEYGMRIKKASLTDSPKG
jgi:hypothetical protein